MKSPFLVCVLLLFLTTARAFAQETPPAEPPATPPATASDPAHAADAKAKYLAALEAYKESVRGIEQLRGEYQAADEARRTEINSKLAEQVKATQKKVDELVDAAVAAYNADPKGDPQIEELLIGIAQHHAVGQPVPLPGQRVPSGGNHAGGDQYEKALPVINALLDAGHEKPELALWGFIAAYGTSDYDLAEKYLKLAAERSVFENEPEGKYPREVLGKSMDLAQTLGKQRQIWAAEQKLRADEAAADNLPRVKLTTSKGDIVLELFENEAPQSVANFISLVKQGYYDGTPFHRVLPMFMAQGGDRDGTGMGSPGYSVRNEAVLPNHRNHFRGSISMARGEDLDSAGSQFFLCFRPEPELDDRYTVFGRIVEGIDVLGELQRIQPDPREAEPPHPIPDKLLKAEVLRDRGHDYKFDKLQGR
jgi:cyclophilin family peptidyl-prolyl cis-trans isomerase